MEIVEKGKLINCSSCLILIYKKNIRSHNSIYIANTVVCRGINLAKEKRDKLEAEEMEPEKTAGKVGGNIVLIGRKPVMNYVVACLTFFNSGEKEVVVKARGRAISRAVDAVELLRRGFIKNLTVGKIEIGTEEMTRPEGRRTNVSTIEITVVKSESK